MELGGILSIVIGAYAASASAVPATEQVCGPGNGHWLSSAEEPYGYVLRVSVRRNGSIIWDGHSASPQEIHRYLSATRELNPRPYLVLEYEPGVDCAELDRLRREFNERAQCGTDGLCAERRSSRQ